MAEENNKGWMKRCGELVKIRNKLQQDNARLLSAIAKVTMYMKDWVEEDIDKEKARLKKELLIRISSIPVEDVGLEVVDIIDEVFEE